jgi:hypothetical protein
MPVCIWISVVLLLTATVSCMTGRPPMPTGKLALTVRGWLVWGVDAGLGIGILLLVVAGLSPVQLAEIGAWAAASAGIAQAAWIGLMMLGRANTDDDDEEGSGPGTPDPPDDPLLPWGDFDRIRAGWSQPKVPITR